MLAKTRAIGRFFFYLLTIFLFLSSFGFSAQDDQKQNPVQSTLDKIIEQKVIRVGTTGDYKPFTFYDEEKKEFVGSDIDMAKDLAKELGVEVEFVKTTWKQIDTDLVEGKYDIAMGGISVKLSRQLNGFFSIPYLVTGKTPITRKENVDKFDTLEKIDQKDVTVIVNPGGTNEKFVNAHIKNAKVIVFDDNNTIFNEIVENRADLMITDAVETMLQEKLHPELAAVHPLKPFDKFEKAYLLPEGDIIFKEWVDLWLHTAMLTGKYQKIFDAHIK
jgi:cyclohexadienyl dehydratase